MIDRIRRFVGARLRIRVNDYVRDRDLSAMLAVVRQRDDRACAVVIGSSSGQEMPLYTRFFREIHLVDPLIPQLKMHPLCAGPNVHLHPVAVSCTPGRRSFFVASNNGESSSLSRPTLHLSEYPGITFAPGEVPVQRLGDLDFFARASVLVLDVQGHELDVLRSADPVGLGHLSMILCEYSLVPLYEGSGVLADLQELLAPQGFKLAFTTTPYVSPNECTGDAVFVRDDLFARPGADAPKEQAAHG